MAEILGQQTFMGASIVNFNLQLKYDLNPSVLDLNLIVDKDNKVDALGNPRVYNAVDEGYHAFKTGHFPNGLVASALATAGGIANLYHNSGDFFYTAELGSPVWFNYYRFDKNPATEVVTLFPTVPQHPWYFNGLLSAIREDHSTQGGRIINARIEDPRKILAGMKVILGSHNRWTAPADGSYGVITDPINRQFRDGHVGFYNVLNVFGMIEEIQGFGSADRNKSGLVWYDPFPGKMSFRNILEILQVMLMGKPGPAWEVHGRHTPGFPVFSEPAGYQPHPFWNGDYFTTGQERFGGPPYYVTNLTNTPDGPFNPAIAGFGTSPRSAYRYKVDLSELSLLTEGQHPDGLLDSNFRIGAEVVSLLDLISQVCKAANADFYVELLPDAAPWPPNFPAGFVPVYGEGVAGVIKIKVIHRVRPPVPGLLLRYIESSKRDPFDIPDPPFDQWRGRMASSKIGYEFGDEIMGAIIIVGARTRVIGVSDLGADRLRGEYVSPLDPTDILREWTQFDGVRGPQIVGPPAFVDSNKFSKDAAVPAMPPATLNPLPLGRKIADKVPANGAVADVASEQDDYRNDIWDVAPNNMPADMRMTVPTGLGGSNVNANVPLGDDKIDLFPAFGLTEREDYCWHIAQEHPCNAIIGCSWDVPQAPAAPSCKQTVNLPLEGQPNIGFFNADEPMKDFNPPNQANITDRKAGLLYTVQWVTPNCDVIPGPNLPGTPLPLFPGGIYNEANCPGEDEWKGGPGEPKPNHTRPRIRREGEGCVNNANQRMIPAVSQDECLCGYCSDPGGGVLAHVNRKACEDDVANGGAWTIGIWDVAAGNCSVGDPTDNFWGGGGGTPVNPQTAIIEIDMVDVTVPNVAGSRILYNGGDTINGQFPKRKHLYKTTVTELRAAAVSKDSWISYITNFNPRLVELMGWDGHMALEGIFKTIYNVDAMGVEVDVAGKGGVSASQVSEFERIQTDADPTRAVPVGPAGLSQPDVDAAYSLTGAAAGMLSVKNSRAQKFRADRADYISPLTSKGVEMETFYEKIRDIATNWYGKKYLMPLPFDPEIIDQHIREIKIPGAASASIASKPSFELDWDITGAGWIDVDMKSGGGKNGNLVYPQNFEFYDDDGKLQPFFTYPTLFQSINRDGNVTLEHVDHTLVDKKTKHITLPSNHRGYNAGNGGKVFVRASVDPKTYWLWEPQAGVQFDVDGNFVDAVHGGGEEWFLQKVDTEGSANAAAGFVLADGDTGPVPLRLKPYALLTLEQGPVNYHGGLKAGAGDPLKNDSLIAQRELLAILEFLFPTGVVKWGDTYRPGAEWIKAGLAAAAFKPYQAAVPQISNRESWGPWGGGISFGKVEVKKDDNLTPENAGSMSALNKSAKSQLRKTLVSQQIAETGSVELVGGPHYFAGRPIVVFGVLLGPYITGITVDIGATSAVTTTYTMSSWIPELPGGAGPREEGEAAKGYSEARKLIEETRQTTSDILKQLNKPKPSPPPPSWSQDFQSGSWRM